MNKVLICSILLVVAGMVNATIIREPAVAGFFYPENKAELEKDLESYFRSVDLGNNVSIIPAGLISPHAGYFYSGKIAAQGYSLLKNEKYDTVILIGSSHNFFKDVVTIYDGDYCRTPLGDIQVNRDITAAILAADKRFVFAPEIHEPEHSLEVQLPFLQFQMKKFQVVLILTSTNDLKLLDKLAEILIAITRDAEKKVLFVCSTDMSHYHKYDTACTMDHRTIDYILQGKWQDLQKDIFSKKCELCGYFALYPFLQVMSSINASHPVLLKYMNSGDVIGDTKNKVVGYCSIVFSRDDNQINKQNEESTMTDKQRKYLLELARSSIAHYLDNNKLLQPDKPDDPLMLEDRAVFVTLHKDNELRGCIGHMQSRMPLYQAVIEMAVSAAVNDYRFPKVSKKELADINIEISVLTPMQQVYDPDQIRMGIDGVWVQKGYQSGVYLPQVATETGWDRKTFLESLCAHKAGLAPDAYLDKDTKIFVFQVEKFNE